MQSSSEPRLATLGCLWIVAMLGGGSLHAQTPIPAGPQFLVNTYTTGTQSSPSMAMDADGDFVVLWGNGSLDTRGQRYASDGSSLGDEFQVNTYTTYRQYSPSVAVDADGDFVVLRHSMGSYGSDTSDSDARHSPEQASRKHPSATARSSSSTLAPDQGSVCHFARSSSRNRER